MFKKAINQIVLIAFVGLIISNMIFYKGCRDYKEKYSLEHNRVSLYEKVDSILDLPPEIITLPPEIIKEDSIVFVTKWKERPKDAELEPQIYKYSILNDSIDIKLEIAAMELFDIKSEYRPIYKYQTRIIKKYVPKPFDVIKEIKVPQNGFYLNAGLGYGSEVSVKFGLTYLTKNETMFSYDFVAFGRQKVHLISYGVKL